MLPGSHGRRGCALANRRLSIPPVLVRHNNLLHLVDVLRGVSVPRKDASRVDVVAVVDLYCLSAGGHNTVRGVVAAYFAGDQSVHPVTGLSAAVGAGLAVGAAEVVVVRGVLGGAQAADGPVEGTEGRDGDADDRCGQFGVSPDDGVGCCIYSY